MNNMALERAQKWFSELDIRTEEKQNCLFVNRSDMLILDSTQLPEVAYDFMLKELKSALGYTRYYWAGKDDEWLYLETI